MCVIGTASDCKVCFTCISTGQHSDIKVICYKQIFPNKFLNPNGLVLGGTIKKKKRHTRRKTKQKLFVSNFSLNKMEILWIWVSRDHAKNVLCFILMSLKGSCSIFPSIYFCPISI